MATIQFFGLPGSGKTFLLNKLKTGLLIPGFSAVSREECVVRELKDRDHGPITALLKKLPSALWHRLIHEDYCLQEFLDYLVKYPALYSRILDVAGQSQASEESIRSAVGALAKTSVEHALCQSSGKETYPYVLLADEWFYHRIYTIYSHCDTYPNDNQLSDLIDEIPDTNGAVFIATPPALCLERMVNRNHIPQYLTGLSDTEIESKLTRYHILFEEISDELRRKGRSVATYDGVSPDVDHILNYCHKIVSSNQVISGI